VHSFLFVEKWVGHQKLIEIEEKLTCLSSKKIKIFIEKTVSS